MMMKNSFNDISHDLYRYCGSVSMKQFFYNVCRSPGFRFTYFFRYSKRWSRKTVKGFFFYMFYRKYSIRYGFQIPLTVKIGKGLALPHFGGIVINSKAIIGENCNILHNVTIGNQRVGKNKGAPTIGNHVFVGAGSVIIGEVSVGDHVLIAPNTFVNQDVPAHSIVYGNPCEIKSRIEASSGHMINSLKEIII